MKNYYEIEGIVVLIGDLIHIERKNAPDLYKKVLTIETKDGQKLYPEIRNSKIKQLDNIDENSIVNIKYSFEGSEKNNKRYNNIRIHKITKL